VATISLIDTFSAPDCVDNFLTRRTFDESLGPTDDSHFDSVADSILQVLILFPNEILCHRIGTGINRPAGDRDHNQVKEVIAILA